MLYYFSTTQSLPLFDSIPDFAIGKYPSLQYLDAQNSKAKHYPASDFCLTEIYFITSQTQVNCFKILP